MQSLSKNDVNRHRMSTNKALEMLSNLMNDNLAAINLNNYICRKNRHCILLFFYCAMANDTGVMKIDTESAKLIAHGAIWALGRSILGTLYQFSMEGGLSVMRDCQYSYTG